MPVLHTFSSSPQAGFVAKPLAPGAGHTVNDATRSSPCTYWPVGPMQAFTLCMASHGFCVSSAMMLGDRQYALSHLARAHTLNDDALRELAVLLFQQLETQH
mgnify:CR=1 FL=1